MADRNPAYPLGFLCGQYSSEFFILTKKILNLLGFGDRTRKPGL